jgi:hypothetical protein
MTFLFVYFFTDFSGITIRQHLQIARECAKLDGSLITRFIKGQSEQTETHNLRSTTNSQHNLKIKTQVAQPSQIQSAAAYMFLRNDVFWIHACWLQYPNVPHNFTLPVNTARQFNDAPTHGQKQQ